MSQQANCLPNGTNQISSLFSSALKFLQDHTMAGDEVSGKQVDDFLKELGVPETPADKNALLALANVPANTVPGQGKMDLPPAFAGSLGSNLEACKTLRRLLDEGLHSMSATRKEQLRKGSERVVRKLKPFLQDEPFALRLLSTLAGWGVFGIAGWLIWTASEKDWKIGTWGVLVMGTLRLLGNLIYNDVDLVKQTCSMLYVHVGLGSVGYLVEILTRAGVTVADTPATTVATVVSTLIPLLGFYLSEIRSAGRQLSANREHKRSSPVSADDIDVLRPIFEAFQAYIEKSKSLTGRATTIKAGNRTAAVAKVAQSETQALLDSLKLDVAPQATISWRELFKSFLVEAAKKSPSIIYALFTAIFLFAAALGNVKATIDVATLAILLLVETTRGIMDNNLAPSEMAYRVLLLTLGRFGSIFFFGVPVIHDYCKTGKTDLFQRDPELAVLMAHLNAIFITVFGLYIIPTIELFLKFASWAYRKARLISDQSRGELDELDKMPRVVLSEVLSASSQLGTAENDASDFDDEKANLFQDWESSIEKISVEASERGGPKKQARDQENDGTGSFVYMMMALGGLGSSSDVDPEMMAALGKSCMQ